MSKKCYAETCTQDATHLISWPEAHVHIELCPQHLTEFVNASMKVTTDIVPMWRKSENAQMVLNSMLDQVEYLLQEGQKEKCHAALDVAKIHYNNCLSDGVTVNGQRLSAAIERVSVR
jgi:hypothetical protein